MSLEMNNVEIEDTYVEGTDHILTRFVLTSVTEQKALKNANFLRGGVITYSPLEAFVERQASPLETPDGRPGIILQVLERADRIEGFLKALGDLLSITPHLPTCSIFDMLPEDKVEDTINPGEKVSKWGDGFEREDELHEREVYVVPVMTGEYLIERELGIATKGVDAALELAYEDQISALRATEAAANRVENEIEGAFAKNLCGAKVGGINYEDVGPTSNTPFCPTIRDEFEDTKVPEGSNSNIEYLVWGWDEETTREGLEVSLEALTNIPGLLKVDAFNQNGEWGDHKIFLRDFVK